MIIRVRWVRWVRWCLTLRVIVLFMLVLILLNMNARLLSLVVSMILSVSCICDSLFLDVIPFSGLGLDLGPVENSRVIRLVLRGLSLVRGLSRNCSCVCGRVSVFSLVLVWSVSLVVDVCWCEARLRDRVASLVCRLVSLACSLVTWLLSFVRLVVLDVVCLV